MKKIYLITLLNLLFSNAILAQKLPEDIAKTINELKKETSIRLNNIRTNPKSGSLYISYIQWILPTEQFKKAEKLNLKLDLGLIYDNDSRNRLLQLLKKEYRGDEIDTLLTRYLKEIIYAAEITALKSCKFDTMHLFKVALDSFYREIKRIKPNDYGYPHFYNYEVFKILKLDTTTVFKEQLEFIIEKRKNSFIKNIGNNKYVDLSSYAKLCGLINDKRFVQPLIEALNKPGNFNRQVVIEALARMKVEPYCTELLKENTKTISDIEFGESADWELLLYVIRNQESFLELSKYLKSDAECSITSDEYYKRRYGDELKYCVFEALYNNLENKDLKRILNIGGDKFNMPYDKTPEIDVAVERLYLWMQKNYGKYKFTWYYY